MAWLERYSRRGMIWTLQMIKSLALNPSGEYG